MKKKDNLFKKILTLLFIVYIGLYIAGITGYYENATRKDTLNTSEQIIKFEQDIKNGVVLDTSSYLEKKPDYANIFTKSANYVSDKLGIIINHKSKNLKEFFKALFIGDIFV